MGADAFGAAGAGAGAVLVLKLPGEVIEIKVLAFY